jgi:hypothetical protein
MGGKGWMSGRTVGTLFLLVVPCQPHLPDLPDLP